MARTILPSQSHDQEIDDTRFGQVTFRRWFFQNVEAGEAGEAGLTPLDLRLGLIASRMIPAAADVTERLATVMPQQAVLDALQERFAIKPGVATLRRVVSDLGERFRTHHDDATIVRLTEVIEQARQSQRILLDSVRSNSNWANAELAVEYCQLSDLIAVEATKCAEERPLEWVPETFIKIGSP